MKESAADKLSRAYRMGADDAQDQARQELEELRDLVDNQARIIEGNHRVVERQARIIKDMQDEMLRRKLAVESMQQQLARLPGKYRHSVIALNNFQNAKDAEANKQDEGSR